MSLFNMALRNVRKSFRDYVVYFLTLIFGVAVFYVFNSIGDQSIIVNLSESGYEMIQLMLLLLEGLSIAVAFVLGFLIIYANNFLIRRRKREFGIYLLLGMGKGDVSKLLLGETFLVGLLSLAAGLGIGIFASQFMSILVGKFFEADMSAYVFTISVGAIIKTIVNFTVIYVIVLLFHSISISKYELIQLFSSEKRTEKQVIRKPVIGIVLFILSALVLGIAYYRVGFCMEEVYRTEFFTHILLGIIATLLLFWSLSGFLLSVLRKWNALYYNKLNAFVIRQFCNNINTSAISMGIICLMLFATICTFSAGFSLAHQLQENIRKLTPVDYSIMYTGGGTVKELFAREGWRTEEWAGENSIEVPVYSSATVTYATSLDAIFEQAKEQFPYARWETQENIMRLSDYNKLASLYGQETHELSEDEYLVVCNFILFEELRNMTLKQGGIQTIGSVELQPAKSECVDGYLCMTGMNANLGVIVVPDAVMEQLDAGVAISGYVMAGDYLAKDKKEKKAVDNRLNEMIASYITLRYANENPIPPMAAGTKIVIRESNNGLSMMVAFLVIYVGVVFLISSAALLALKALSESIDSTGKFAILKKMGSDGKMLNRALFVQIGTYFALPLLVAGIHSVFGLRYIDYSMQSFTRQGLGWGVAVTTVLMLVLYGGYMLATFRGSKRIVDLD